MTLVWVGVALALAGMAYYLWQGGNSAAPTIKNQLMERQDTLKDNLPEAYIGKTPIYQEYSAGDRYTSPNGMMLFDDGQIIRLSDFTVKVENGKPIMEKGELMWREEINISDKGVEEISSLIKNFKPHTKSELDPKLVVNISFSSAGKSGKAIVSGNATPENYEFFTAVNRAISLNTISHLD